MKEDPNMTTKTTGQEEEYDTTIYGSTYRTKGENRSKAVTEALNLFTKDHPNFDIPLNILRKRVSTKRVDSDSELIEEYLRNQ